MKKSLLAMALMSATSAQANCWKECILANPINGNCIKHVKVCDVSDPMAALDSFDNDITRVTNDIISGWHDVYGHLPSHIRQTLNHYPLTVACLLAPETRAWALVLSMLEGISFNTRDRIQQAKPILQNPETPAWKKKLIDEGIAYLFVTEGGVLATTDWNSDAAQPYRNKYGEIYTEFLQCIDRAPNLNPEGEDCSWDFKDKVIDLSRPRRPGRSPAAGFIFQPFDGE